MIESPSNKSPINESRSMCGHELLDTCVKWMPSHRCRQWEQIRPNFIFHVHHEEIKINHNIYPSAYLFDFMLSQKMDEEVCI